MTDEKTRALIAEARTDISDAERCEMLGVTPSVGTLLRMLRNVTNALSALTVPDGDALEKLKAEALKSWQAGVEIRRYSEFFTSFEDGFDRGYAAALSRAAAPEEPDDEPCKAETHSWSHYQPEQIDSYWIRCTRLGEHDEHEDSHTGLRWRAALPVGGETE